MILSGTVSVFLSRPVSVYLCKLDRVAYNYSGAASDLFIYSSLPHSHIVWGGGGAHIYL